MLELLPLELLVLIIEYLPVSCILKLAQTSTYFRSLITNFVWTHRIRPSNFMCLSSYKFTNIDLLKNYNRTSYNLRFDLITKLKIGYYNIVNSQLLSLLSGSPLIKLTISNNSILVDDDFKFLSNLRLRTLKIIMSNISEKALEYIPMENMQSLTLNYCNLNNLKFLTNANNLKKLDLDHCYKLSDQNLQYIPFSKLETLYVNGIKIRNDQLSYLLNCNRLHIDGTKITDYKCFKDIKFDYLNIRNIRSNIGDALEYLSNCKELTFTNAICNNANFKHLTNCKEILFYLCRDINWEGFQYLTNCESIGVHTNYYQVTKKDVLHLIPNKLKTIYLNNQLIVGDDYLEHLFKTQQNLTNLLLTNCYIQPGCLKELCVSKLTVLELSSCHNINDGVLKYFENGNLIKVTLSNTNISDLGLIYLSSNPIKKLNINCCIQITDEGISYLNVNILVSIYIRECMYITKKMVNQLISKDINVYV